MSSIWGALFILIGLSIMITGEVKLGIGVGNHIEGWMKYIIALPIILWGVYIIYLNSEKNKQKK